MTAATLLRSLVGGNRTIRSLKRRLVGGRRPFRIPAQTDVVDFLNALEEAGVRYVLLSWTDGPVPDPASTEFTLLVGDDDIGAVSSRLVRSPNTSLAICTIYTVQGFPGTSYRGTAFFPPYLAAALIERAVRTPGGVRVPCPEDRFLSLAFHALFHRGYDSGLPLDQTDCERRAEAACGYSGVLERLARPLGITVPMTMRDLTAELTERGWFPPHDTLVKWSHKNAFCRDLAREAVAGLKAPDGLAVLLVRDAGAGAETLMGIRKTLLGHGFEILHQQELDPAPRARATGWLRGGNWGQGPFPRSGGAPAVLIVARDPQPERPSERMQIEHPGIDNARILDVKYAIRDWWNAQLPRSERCNIVHSSDSAIQAAHYLKIVLGDDEDLSERWYIDTPGQVPGRAGLLA
jgi:hypothetical protein